VISNQQGKRQCFCEILLDGRRARPHHDVDAPRLCLEAGGTELACQAEAVERGPLGIGDGHYDTCATGIG